MPEFITPDDTETETEPVEESEPTEMPPLPTVQFMDENMEMPMAVQHMAHMMDRPGDFGMATEDELQELRDEVERYRSLAIQHREAIAELAESFELLNQILIDEQIGGVALDQSELEGIYDPMGEFDD